MIRKYFCFAIFAIIYQLALFSEIIAIASFQNENVDESCKLFTQTFEDSLFEPFFDAGFIVTSIPNSYIKEDVKINSNKLKELFDEPSDYILICRMEYGADLIFNNKLKEKVPDWHKITILLINFDTEKEIYSKTFKIPNIKEPNPYKIAGKFSAKIADEAINAINTSKGGSK